MIQPCLSQPAARPSVGFHGKLPSKTRREGATAGVTQPQLEASAGEARQGKGGGAVPKGLVPLRQRVPGMAPGSLLLGGAALCNHLWNTSPSWSTPSRSLLVGTGEEEREMSKAQTHPDPHPEPTGWAAEEGLSQPRRRGRDGGVCGEAAALAAAPAHAGLLLPSLGCWERAGGALE